MGNKFTDATMTTHRIDDSLEGGVADIRHSVREFLYGTPQDRGYGPTTARWRGFLYL